MRRGCLLIAPPRVAQQQERSQEGPCDREADLMCQQLVRYGECSGCSARRRRRQREAEKQEREQRSSSKLNGRTAPTAGQQLRRRRRGADLVTATAAASVLLASSTIAAAAAAATSSSVSVISCCWGYGYGRRRSLHELHTAFVLSTVDSPRRWAVASRYRRIRGANTQYAASHAGSERTYSSSSSSSAGRASLRGGFCSTRGDANCRRLPPRRALLRMISAAGRGDEGAFSAGAAEFLPPDEAWKRFRAQQESRIGSPSAGPDHHASRQQQKQQQQQRPLSESRARRAQAGAGTEAASGGQQHGGASSSSWSSTGRSAAVGSDVVSWTPKREGPGSWDRVKAVEAGLEPPVWRVDLRRGIYTGDVKIKQVCYEACMVVSYSSRCACL